MAISDPVAKPPVLAQFITLVKNPVMAVASSWHSANPPPGHDAAHPHMGAQAEADPTWPASVGEVTTTNVFYILHGFALKLTRHRQGRAWVRNDTAVPTYLGYALTSHVVNNVIWFDYPAIPAVGAPMTAADITNFLNALRLQVLAIRGNAAFASDFYGCHTSCHSSCHGSRGRR